jgi:hypothetical protein
LCLDGAEQSQHGGQAGDDGVFDHGFFVKKLTLGVPVYPCAFKGVTARCNLWDNPRA